MEYTKETLEQFTFQVEDKEEHISIDTQSRALFCISSYGNYSFSWGGRSEEPFISFLLKIEPEYLLERIARDEYYYAGKTKETWKETIKEDCCLDDQSKEAILKIMDGIDFGVSRTASSLKNEGIVLELEKHAIVTDNYDAPSFHFFPYISYPPQAYKFIEKVWSAFQEILREEQKNVKRKIPYYTAKRIDPGYEGEEVTGFYTPAARFHVLNCIEKKHDCYIDPSTLVEAGTVEV